MVVEIYHLIGDHATAPLFFEIALQNMIIPMIKFVPKRRSTRLIAIDLEMSSIQKPQIFNLGCLDIGEEITTGISTILSVSETGNWRGDHKTHDLL